MATEDSRRPTAAGQGESGLALSAEVRPVSLERLRVLLDTAGIPWSVDHAGDLGILWRRGTIRVDVWNTGQQPGVVLLSATWHRRATLERLPRFMDIAEEWNAASTGLKTYLRVLDDGDVLVCFERSLMVRTGASDAQLAGFVPRSIAAIFDRVAQLEAMFPDPIAQPEEDL